MGDDGRTLEENMISREENRELYERVVIPTVVCGSKTWFLSAQKKEIEVIEMMCLRNIRDKRRVDSVRNSLIRERFGCELSVLERIERKC